MVVKLNLIGAGRVGQTICHLANRSGAYHIQDIASRDMIKTNAAIAFIGGGHAVANLDDMRPADIWLLTVPDSQIAATAAQLTGHGPSCALHCSGFLPATEMQPLANVGWHLASAHPVYSFADPAVAVAHFAGTQVGIEGDPPATQAAQGLFSTIGAQCFAVRSEAKAIYHGAAVFANNLTTVLQALAREAWAEAGLTPAVIDDLHQGLLRATVENILRLGPQAGLTGPAARGDLRVVNAQHAAIVAWHPKAGAVYQLLSDMAANLKVCGTTRPDQTL